MFNYIWAGLILVSFLFALGQDVADLGNDRFANGTPLQVTIDRPPAATSDSPVANSKVTVRIDLEKYVDHFHLKEIKKSDADVLPNLQGEFAGNDEVKFTAKALPTVLAVMRKHLDSDDAALSAFITAPGAIKPGESKTVQIRFPVVRFVKLNAITSAAIEFAGTAFKVVVIGLVGPLCLWLGLLKIAEEAGLVNVMVKVVQPILKPLFPGVPKDHPALGMISLNVAANMLSLGNAATPMGIKAMTELQKLNPSKDTATNAMVMLLAINTAGVTLLPPPNMVALFGTRMNAIIIPIWASTAVSLVIAIIACTLLGKLSVYRKSDPGDSAIEDASAAT
ncbi:MAG: nucleoside recognition domain-containing protein [Tepidisphaeraceae bacterium]